MYDIETHTVTRPGATVTVRIVPDDDPESPRFWDNLDVMFCNHRDYILGDERLDPGQFESEEQLLDHLRETYDPTVILPLYLLDHSGLAMKAGAPRPGTRSPFIGDEQGWDTSMVGFILDTADTRRLLGIPDDTSPDEMTTFLLSEVEDYSTYLEGGVVGYVIEDEDGNHLDSCFGFFGIDDCRAEALDAAEHCLDELVPQREIEAGYRDLARSYDVGVVPDDAEVELAERNGNPGAYVTVRVFVPATDAVRVPS